MPPTLLPKESLASPEARARLLAALQARAKKNNVRVEHSDVGESWYSPEDRLIVLGNEGSDEELPHFAHELGHVEFNQGVVGRLIQSPAARRVAGFAGPIGGIIGAVAQGSLARRMAISGGVVAALQLPLLTGEAVASIKGHKMLQEYGASQELLNKHKREMLKGFGTYLRPGAFGLVGALTGTLVTTPHR